MVNLRIVGETLLPGKTKTAAPKATTSVAEGTTAETAKKDAPGFITIFAVAGVLAALCAVLRRRG